MWAATPSAFCASTAAAPHANMAHAGKILSINCTPQSKNLLRRARILFVSPLPWPLTEGHSPAETACLFLAGPSWIPDLPDSHDHTYRHEAVLPLLERPKRSRRKGRAAGDNQPGRPGTTNRKSRQPCPQPVSRVSCPEPLSLPTVGCPQAPSQAPSVVPRRLSEPPSMSTVGCPQRLPGAVPRRLGAADWQSAVRRNRTLAEK